MNDWKGCCTYLLPTKSRSHKDKSLSFADDEKELGKKERKKDRQTDKQTDRKTERHDKDYIVDHYN